MKPNLIKAASLGLALVALLGGDALAQMQSKDQAKCLTSMAKTARKISGAVLKDSVNCIRKGAVGQLPPGETAEHCLIADLKGKVAKARASLDAAELKSCAVAPDFAFPGATVTGDGYYDGNLNLLEDGFGASLDATLVASDGVDPDGRCSAVLPAAWRKLEDAMLKAVDACLKAGLKDGTIVAAAGFEACYQSILTDSRGKVAKAVAVVSTQLSSKCPAGSLAAMFPGLVPICSVYGAGTDAAGLASCSRERLECRTCLILNSAYGLHRDCDQFDDALANGSCPACGNTVIDADEQCDDGNVGSGDGCTALCIDESCGDGVVNDGGAETCDNGEANSDTTPGACRTNCQPAGCGDGVIDSGSGEQCDDGNTTSGDGCTATCIDEFCGDEVVNDGGAETCDDGNTTSGDGCTALCIDEFCGDGVVNDDGAEECDDSNATSGDGCTGTCIDEFCGDGVVNDNGTEQCDNGPSNSNTTPGACRTNCRNAGCGDGIIDLGEQCDDSNNATGDCCGATCQHDVLGTPCPGTSGTCVAPACNGAGACLQLPANEGTPCEDDDICTASSTCQSGACATAEYSGVGTACNYVVVGAPWNPSQPNKATLLKSLSGMQSVGGDWCGLRGDFDVNSVFSGDIVATKDDLDNRAIRFAGNVSVSGGDIVTGGKPVISTGAAINLPGLATNTVSGGLFVPKTPSPTFYDTTGTDPRVAECEAAQNGIAATKAVLDGLPATDDFGNAYQDLLGSSFHTIAATVVGGLNVFDMTHLSGSSTNVTVTLDGGGSPDTVMVLRISTRFNTGEAWTFNLTGGLTADHLLIYVSKNAGGIEGCSVGIDNVGGGTLFCPRMEVHILSGTTWYGAAYGGNSGTDGEIRVEESTLIYTPFTAALP